MCQGTRTMQLTYEQSLAQEDHLDWGLSAVNRWTTTPETNTNLELTVECENTCILNSIL